jgi:hypothetical protein
LLPRRRQTRQMAKLDVSEEFQHVFSVSVKRQRRGKQGSGNVGAVYLRHLVLQAFDTGVCEARALKFGDHSLGPSR